MKPQTRALYIVTTASLGIACTGFATTPITISNPPPPKVLATISQTDDGSCLSEAPFDCPPDVMCNPPAPAKVECPPLKETGVENRAGTCVAVAEFVCPPETACHTPKYKEMPCPEGLQPGETLKQDYGVGCYVQSKENYREVLCPPHLDRPIPDNYDVWQRNDGTCWASPPENCPPDATCNPPPPKFVKCPDNLNKK